MKAKRHGGVVTAAGASTRMGSPKALLPAPGGIPLARRQADLLAEAGCDPVVVIVGSDGDAIAETLGDPRVVVHAGWARGRVSSVQAGLRALGTADGALVLPVDTVGVSLAVLRAVLAHADRADAEVIRPVSHGTPGRLVWVSRRTADRILALESTPSLRLDQVLEPMQDAVDVGDGAIGTNVNTPAEWEVARRLL